MKSTIIAIAMATSLATPLVADEFMHKEVGIFLDLASKDTRMQFFLIGLASGLVIPCGPGFDEAVGGQTMEQMGDNLLVMLRKKHASGFFFGLPKMDASPLDIIAATSYDEACN